jgi:putative membrane protein (TIGR04086 family)
MEQVHDQNTRGRKTYRRYDSGNYRAEKKKRKEHILYAGTGKLHESRKQREAEQADRPQTWKTLLGRVGFSALVGAVLFFVLLLPISFVCMHIDLDVKWLPFIAIPLAAIVTLIAAYICVRPTRKHGFLLGLLVAVALSVILLFASWLSYRSPLGINALLLLLAQLVGGAAGGIFAANKA